MSNSESYLVGVSDTVLRNLEEDGFEGLSEPERVFVCIWELEREVNNGGFDQFFFNPAGEYALETVEALEEIGAGHTAGLVRRANAVFAGGGPPKDRVARQDILLALDEKERAKLEELDALFYEYRDDLSQLLYEFVRKHKGAIRGA